MATAARDNAIIALICALIRRAQLDSPVLYDRELLHTHICCGGKAQGLSTPEVYFPPYIYKALKSTIWRETFEGENFHGLVRSDHFRRENFHGMLKPNIHVGGYGVSKFCGENLRG